MSSACNKRLNGAFTFSQGRLDAIDLPKAVEYVLSCMNFDGGFGCRPGSESHSGQVLCNKCLIGMIVIIKHHVHPSGMLFITRYN